MTPIPEIEAMLAKCTPGEWKWDGDVWGYDREQEAPWLLAGPDDKRVLWGEINAHESDAKLIARAPSLLRELIERVRAMEKVVEAASDVDIRFGPHTNEHEQVLREALAEYRALTTEKP